MKICHPHQLSADGFKLRIDVISNNLPCDHGCRNRKFRFGKIFCSTASTRNFGNFARIVETRNARELSNLLTQAMVPNAISGTLSFTRSSLRMLHHREFQFEAVKRWTNQCNIFTFDLIFFPIHIESFEHWTLAVCDFRNKTFKHSDDLFFNNQEIIIKNLKKRLIEEFKNRVIEKNLYPN